MAEPFIGQIMIFAGNFAPTGWAFCDGSLLPIAQFQAVFALLSTTYGGDGQTTFALPDLRGRVAIGMGAGPGLSNYALGQAGGAESVTLTTAQIPAHQHPVAVAVNNDGASPLPRPGGNILGPASIYSAPTAADASLGGVTCGNTGGGGAHENRQPFLAVNYIIALEGIFPQRS